jgi:twitching motility protein PilT
MKPIEELLSSLARPEVLEFGLVTNRLPSINVGGKFEPVDDDAPSSEHVLQMLVKMGGGRFVETLREKPAQWTTTLEGVGVISVAAILREDIVQARFSVVTRERSSQPSPPAATGSVPAPRISAPPRPGATLATPRTGPSFTPQAIKVPPIPSTSVAPPRRLSSPSASLPGTPTPPAAAAPPAPAVPKKSRGPWDEDDEPTLQTVVAALPPLPKPPMPAKIPTPTSIDQIEVLPPRDRGSDTYIVGNDSDEDSLTGPLPAKPATGSVGAVSPETAADKPRAGLDAAISLDAFLGMAVGARASDLHLVAGRPVLVRVASDLVSRTEPLPAEQVERMVKDIVPSRLREQLEREGACDFAIEHPAHGRFRAHVSRQRTGYKLSFRVIAKEVPSLASLGLPGALRNVARLERGLVLVTGTRAQGKSCTVAALVDHLNRETARHIMTIEEPIEHLHPKRKGIVSQRDAALHSTTRTRAFESALREDVDVLVLGELRDVASARQALAACEGGRLVIATMAAASPAKAIEGLCELFPSGENAAVRASIALALRLVIGQRLLPSGDRMRLHPAVEVVPWSMELHDAIREGREGAVGDVARRASSPGGIVFDDSLAELVQANKITLETAKSVADSPSTLEARAARAASAGKKV